MTKRAEAPVFSGDTASRAYQVWLPPSRVQTIRTAWGHADQTWPEWSQEAVLKVSRLDSAELRQLLSAWNPSRKGKEIFSFRLFNRTLESAKMLADSHGGTLQALFFHAHYIQALSYARKKDQT